MKAFVALLLLCVVCAILKAAVVALVAALLLTLLWSLLRQPGETLLFLASLALMGLANARPLACIVALSVLGIAVVVAGARQKAGPPLLLTDGREHP